MTQEDFDKIIEITDNERVWVGDEIAKEYYKDEMPEYGVFPPELYVEVLNKEEVSEIMKYAYEQNIPVVCRTLEAVGFELIDDRRSLLIERLRNAVIELAHYHDDGMRTNLSDYLSEKFHSDYSALSKLFSEMTGITLEKYYIAQRVERVKELLVYNELSLGQIADKLNYSSTAHLSAQFKSVTGITPSEFRKRSDRKRRPLDQI